MRELTIAKEGPSCIESRNDERISIMRYLKFWLKIFILSKAEEIYQVQVWYDLVIVLSMKSINLSIFV